MCEIGRLPCNFAASIISCVGLSKVHDHQCGPINKFFYGRIKIIGEMDRNSKKHKNRRRVGILLLSRQS